MRPLVRWHAVIRTHQGASLQGIAIQKRYKHHCKRLQLPDIITTNNVVGTHLGASACAVVRGNSDAPRCVPTKYRYTKTLQTSLQTPPISRYYNGKQCCRDAPWCVRLYGGVRPKIRGHITANIALLFNALQQSPQKGADCCVKEA